MRLSEEQIERASTVNLPHFLMQNGFDLKRVGREYIWKEHDSMHIKDNAPGERGVWHRFSTDEGGDNIAFLRQYMNMSFVEAVEALNGEHYDRTYTPPQHTHTEKQQKAQAQEFVFSEANNAKRVFAYLCKTRGLDYELVKSLVQSGAVAQEQKTGNVLFKYTDEHGKTVGAEKVGTSTEHKYKGIATGSAGGYGFEVCRGNGSHFLFFESSIDMLSYLQMHQSELTDHRLVSMMGVKPQTVIETMERYGISPDRVYLCSDNDRSGNEFAERLMSEYPDMKRIVTPDTYKDWNDMLRGIPKKEIEQKTENQKEADRMAVIGNEIWNSATDNRDKAVISMGVDDFRTVYRKLEDSGLNYRAYRVASGYKMAVNANDVSAVRQLAGRNLEAARSNVPFSPPEKNIIGNAEYRYITQKEYLSADRDLILKMADAMDRQGIQFSGRIYPAGKGTLTVSRTDLDRVRAVRDDIITRRNQVGFGEKGQTIGNRSVSAQNRHLYMSTLTPNQYEEVKPFIETNARYSGVIRDGKVMFSVDKDEAQAFHRALDTAKREVGLINTMRDLGLPMEQMIALSPIMHRLAAEDAQLQLSDFFDKRYDEAQFGEMLSLVNGYLDQPVAERFGEYSKLNDMLEAKSSFDRSIELSDFFSQHEFSDEQRAAITAMFVGDVTRGQIDSIDETFTVDDIQEYDEILHHALQKSDIDDFLTAHKQMIIDRENAAKEPTEEEKLFMQADLAMFIAESTLSSDEWESMAYPLFENGYIDKHKPNDKALLGYHLSEPEFYDLVYRYHGGEDIRRELALGLMEQSKTDDIDFVFENGKVSTHTYYYAEDLRHTLHAEFGEDSVKLSFGNAERKISYEKIGQAFLDRTFEEFNDLAFWWARDDMLEAIPDISDETIKQLITAFDNNTLADWEKGDNLPKLNRIKKALFDILGDTEQTEKAFAVIAKDKYNVSFEPEKQPDRLDFHFGKAEESADRWFTESGTLQAFVDEHSEISFALANALVEYLDEKQHSERNIEELHTGWYKKTDFTIRAVVDDEEFGYEGRFDIGDGKGTGGGSLIDHIRDYNLGIMEYTQYPFNQPEYKERAKHTLEVFIPFLEAHSELTAEEQKILDDFKEQYPICTYDDVEKAQEKPMPVVDIPEQAEPEYKGPVTLRNVGDFYEMYGKNAEIGAEVLGLHMLSKHGEPMVGFPDHAKDEYSEKLGEAGYSVLIEQAFELNPPKREHEYSLEVSMTSDAFDKPYCIAKVDADGEFIDYYEDIDGEIPTFSTIAEALEYAEDHHLDVKNDLEEISENLLYTLQDVVDKYFGTDCYSAQSVNGTWKLSIADGDKVGELFHNGEAVCGIYNLGDKMAIKPYQELTSFSKMLADAMLAHNPDKPVEIMDFQRTFETPLDKAKALINDFCEEEYSDGADFSNLHNVSLAYTTLTDDELPVQVTADLADFKITYEFDGEVFNVEEYSDIEDMIENGLTGLDFNEMVSVPDSVIDKHIGKNEQTVETEGKPEADIDDDAPLFADADIIEQIQADERADVPFWEAPDVQGEQLSLFGDPEPIQQTKHEKPKSEFSPGPVVDGVQVYEALAAEIDRGTGFVNGKLRVQDFYEEKHPTIQQLADFLKKEYGTGGHSGEGKISLVDYDSKGLTFSFENGEKYRHSWYNVATMTDACLKDDTYLSAEQKAERAALKTERVDEHTAPDTVEVGDRFRHKITGEVSEVVSLTGVLPFYTDDCTVRRESGGFAVTENISYDKLLNSGMYKYIGKAEPEKEQSAPMKFEPAVTPETEKPEIPTVKNLSQLKKAIKPGMMFEITDHLRPECIGERRIVTGITTVDFTSRKLDENGEPTKKDIHMEFDRAKNWTFDGNELTSRLDNGDMLMSFHFIDGLEREQTETEKSDTEKTAPSLDVGDIIECMGKEYKVEELDMGGFITLNETTFDGSVKNRVTFIADEFLSSEDFKVIEPKAEETLETGNNFTITDDSLGEGGAKTKFRANVDAIRTLKTLEAEKRPATAEEKETLSRYVGWGAIPQAFDKSADKWSAEYKELSELLTPEEYRQARSTVGDAFYTSPTIIEGIYEALGNFGFEGGNVLEPAMGVGNFFGCMPNEMQDSSHLYGVEIDSISGRIAQALYPDADIAISGFEKNSFQNGCFDVAVGNVPFGELGFKDTVHDTTKLHDYFFAEALSNVSVNYG